MAISKVVYGDEVLMDLTEDSVTPETLMKGITAHNKSGNQIVGIKEDLDYDEFWDVFQQNGTRTNYNGGFAGLGWNINTFKPKYPIQPKYATYMFYNFSRVSGVELMDLSQFNIDFSKCAGFIQTFANARIISTGFVDCSSATVLNNTFTGSDWGYIQKIHLKVVETNTYTDPFYYCTGLEELIFTEDSIISAKGINLKHSTLLAKESFISTINALSSSTTGLTITFSQTAKQNAFTDEEWATLIATKSNWTIALA